MSGDGKSGGRWVLGESTMTKRCRSCNDGIVVLLTGTGRVETICSCRRGVERAAAEDARSEDQLREKLLAAFHALTPHD